MTHLLRLTILHLYTKQRGKGGCVHVLGLIGHCQPHVLGNNIKIFVTFSA